MRQLLAAAFLAGICAASPAQDRPREVGPNPRQGVRGSEGGEIEKLRDELAKARRDLAAKEEALERLTRDSGRKGDEPRKGERKSPLDESRRGGPDAGPRKSPFGGSGKRDFEPKSRPEEPGEPAKESPRAEAPKSPPAPPTFGGGSSFPPAGLGGLMGGRGVNPFGGAIDEGAQTLIRRKHVLPRADAETILALLDKIAANHGLEIKRERDGVVTTTSPEIDRVVTGLVRLLGSKAAKD